jgi:UDP-GlcNAc:undecaprenyl-phosphate/decaprenyl-phosphate GlcNAc-1-phosphate transferase
MSATLLVLVLAALTALTLTPITRNFARARGWMDRPDGGRKRHLAPVPRIGGVAVFGSFLLTCGVLLVLEPLGFLPGTNLASACIPVALGGAAVMLIGLLDDIRGVPPWAKLVVQAFAALYLYYCGFRIDAVSNPIGGQTVSLGIFALPLTVIWFVGMSNAFNLIDGLDGLAAGIGLFSTTTLFIAAVVNERWEIVLLSAALGGALLGFLRYNFNPASIFLGDSGSLFVGFALAAFAIRGSMKSSAAIAVAAPLLALAVPIADALIAVLRRAIAGRRLFEADGDHIHHRMLRLGFTPRRAVITLYGIAALFGALSLLTMTERSQLIGVVVIASSVVTWIGIQQLGYGEFGELQRLFTQGLQNERQAIGNNVYVKGLKRTFAEAESLDALWRLLSEAAERLGFESFELQLEPQAARELRRYASPPGFPAWRASATATGASSTARWTIPLATEGRPLGQLILTRDLCQPTGCDGAYVVEAVSLGFVARLALLLDEHVDPHPAERAAQAVAR